MRLLCVVAHSLSGTLVDTLDRDGLSADERLSCLNALKMTVYLLCQMCEQYELSFAKPATLAVATKVKYIYKFQCFDVVYLCAGPCASSGEYCNLDSFVDFGTIYIVCLFTLYASPQSFLWSPYGIGQTIIFS